jgi:hypothetical protein
MRDKRAVCPFCGHQVDVPDTYQRVERRHDHESRPGGSLRSISPKSTISAGVFERRGLRPSTTTWSRSSRTPGLLSPLA